MNQGFLLVKLKSSLRKLYGRHHDLGDRYGIPGICVTNDHGYVPLVEFVLLDLLCVCFVDCYLVFFVLFRLAIMLSMHLRFTDSDYPFGIFKIFLLVE